MNMKQQRNYFNSITPEIKRAIRAEYPIGTRYFNTKHIYQRLIQLTDACPILSGKSRYHICDCITTFLKEVPNSTQWSSRNHKSGGKVFFVPNAARLHWLRMPRKKVGVKPATVPAG